MSETLLRTAWAFGIVLLGLLAYWGFNRLLLLRVRRRTRGLEDFQIGRPGVLYFTTPQCQPCLTQQRPALARLQHQLGDQVQLIQVDATQRPDLADYWGVLSVPTTFIIDSQGYPRGVNHGVASTKKLLCQLEAAQGGPFVLISPQRSEPSHAIEKIERLTD
jgi:thioredoxin 1